MPNSGQIADAHVKAEAEHILDDFSHKGMQACWLDLAHESKQERDQVLGYLLKVNPETERYLVSTRILDPIKGFIDFNSTVEKTDKEANRKDFTVQISNDDARKQLETRAKIVFGDNTDQYKQFESELQAFLQSRRAMDSETANVMFQMNRLLADSHNAPVSLANRMRLAHEVLQAAAHPNLIDQGNHNTCVENSLECRMLAIDPSSAVRLVADAATTGQFNCADGTTIKIAKSTLEPEDESTTIPGVNNRSFASQIIQNTLANIHWQRETTSPDGRTVPAGSLRFERIPGNWYSRHYLNEDRLMDYSTNPPHAVKDPEENRPQDAPKLADYAEIYNQVTGKLEQDSDISLQGPFSSAEELQKAIAARRYVADGRGFPVQVGINATIEPFAGVLNFLPQRLLSLAGATPHSIVITGYDPKTGKITIATHESATYDQQQVTVEQLYGALF